MSSPKEGKFQGTSQYEQRKTVKLFYSHKKSIDNSKAIKGNKHGNRSQVTYVVENVIN